MLQSSSGGKEEESLPEIERLVILSRQACSPLVLSNLVSRVYVFANSCAELDWAQNPPSTVARQAGS